MRIYTISLIGRLARAAAPLLLGLAHAPAVHADEWVWQGEELDVRVFNLRHMKSVQTADELIDACDARLVEAPATFATADATDAQIRVARRLEHVFRAHHGLGFVLIPWVDDVITRSFEGVAFDRDGNLRANFAIKHVGDTDGLGTVVPRWDKQTARFNARERLEVKLRDRARYLQKQLDVKGGSPAYARMLEVEFHEYFGELTRFGRLFVPTDPRERRIFVDVAGARPMAPADEGAFLRATADDPRLRFVVLWPDRVRIFMGGIKTDEFGEPVE